MHVLPMAQLVCILGEANLNTNWASRRGAGSRRITALPQFPKEVAGARASSRYLPLGVWLGMGQPKSANRGCARGLITQVLAGQSHPVPLCPPTEIGIVVAHPEPFTPNVNHMAQLWLAGGSSGTSIISGPVALLLFIVVIIVFIVTVVTRRQ